MDQAGDVSRRRTMQLAGDGCWAGADAWQAEVAEHCVTVPECSVQCAVCKGQTSRVGCRETA